MFTSLFTTAILGANGYTGRELARLLLNHPNVKLLATFGRNQNWHLSDELPEPQAKHVKHYPLDEMVSVASELDTLFLATPSEISLEYLPMLNNLGIKIIDLSGALRLSAENFTLWYEQSHPCPELLENVSYGLSPWWVNHTNPSECRLVANPGCYATCAQMALLPLLLAGIIQSHPIIIDAKSGLSGAGRQAKENLLFCEMSHDFYPYKIGCHQHTPEIQTYLNFFSQNKNQNFSQLLLNTHLLPIKRGISMSIYTQLNSDYAHLNQEELSSKIFATFNSAYNDYPLAKFYDLNLEAPTSHKKILSLTKIVGSAKIHIAWYRSHSQLAIFATIDNLLKGAASQAIENFNWLHGLPCATSLENLEGLL